MTVKKETVRGEYTTHGSVLVKEILETAGGNHLSAQAVYALAKQKGDAIGRTTVYRHLSRLAEKGEIRRITVNGVACYAPLALVCDGHYHLVCTVCGTLSHLDCPRTEELIAHVGLAHGFRIDPSQTTLYGLCASCLRRGKQKCKNSKEPLSDAYT